jgi:hypothetical protein
MISRNQHHWLKLQAVLEKQTLLEELHFVAGFGREIQGLFQVVPGYSGSG